MAKLTFTVDKPDGVTSQSGLQIRPRQRWQHVPTISNDTVLDRADWALSNGSRVFLEFRGAKFEVVRRDDDELVLSPVTKTNQPIPSGMH